jgi:hypothetical protein
VRYLFSIALVLALAPACAHAAGLTLFIGADDYARLSVDGLVLGTYDAYPSGGFSSNVDLSPGWHDIAIDYKNRWGSNGLGFSWQFATDPVNWYIPEVYFQSFDQQGSVISGLRADYFDLSGNPQFTVYGEGPISHGASWFGSRLGEVYQGVEGNWGGQYGPWAQFEERLTGQILIPGDVPEPATWTLLSVAGGLCLLIGSWRTAGRRGHG